MPPCTQRRITGFSLIEVLLGTCITLVALAAVPVTLRIITSMMATARDGSVALGIAQAKLEELCLQPGGTGAGSDAVTLGGTSLGRTWRVSPASPRHGTWRITVTVEWEHGARRVALETVTWQP